jgi:Mce-associated membrane protein
VGVRARVSSRPYSKIDNGILTNGYGVNEEVAVPSFRRRASVIDADRVAESPQQVPERLADAEEALALAEEAEAEAAEAEALAAAARARAKAIRLRRQAQTAEETTVQPAKDDDAGTAVGSDVRDQPDEAAALEDTGVGTRDVAVAEQDAAEADEAEADEVVTENAEDTDSREADSAERAAKRRRLRMPRIRWSIVAAVVAILLTLAFVAASGYLEWQHRQQVREQQRTAEYVAAARQSVVTLMSLDFNKAKEDVQRIIDNSAGQFKQDFQDQAEDFAKVAQESKVVTEVTVNVAAVKSMTDTGATAIVSATSRVTNSAGAKQEPRAWRLLVDLVREGDQIKMSKVEFVP